MIIVVPVYSQFGFICITAIVCDEVFKFFLGERLIWVTRLLVELVLRLIILVLRHHLVYATFEVVMIINRFVLRMMVMMF